MQAQLPFSSSALALLLTVASGCTPPADGSDTDDNKNEGIDSGVAGPSGQGGATGSQSGAGAGTTTGPGAGPSGPGAGPGPGSTGAGGQPPESCDPFEARWPTPEVLIGPGEFEPALLAAINTATSTLEVVSYQLSRNSIVNALVAADSRGVTVRVLVDGDQFSNNNAKQTLGNAGIEVKNVPASFEHGHAKYVVADGTRAIVLSGNMNDYTMVTERNYGLVDDAWDDVADLQALFERDWDGTPLDLSCTRLVVGPDNARTRITDLIDSATDKLDLAVMYISDNDIMDAVKARHAAGVPVRVLLANPQWIEENTATAAELESAGIPAKYFVNYDLHAKLIIADSAAYVGSTNMSWTSLEENREVGVMVTEPDGLPSIESQFAADWSAGVTP